MYKFKRAPKGIGLELQEGEDLVEQFRPTRRARAGGYTLAGIGLVSGLSLVLGDSPNNLLEQCVSAVEKTVGTGLTLASTIYLAASELDHYRRRYALTTKRLIKVTRGLLRREVESLYRDGVVSTGVKQGWLQYLTRTGDVTVDTPKRQIKLGNVSNPQEIVDRIKTERDTGIQDKIE